jgi:5-amino-6-(5-phosphoribosylamino)uracil reductase
MQIMACLASSVDGKITAAQLPPSDWVKLGSSADLNRLFTIRNPADAILCGLTTFNAWAGVRWSLNQQQQPESERIAKLHIVLTNSWQFTPEALKVLEQWQPHWPPFIIYGQTPPPPPIEALLKANPNVLWLNLPLKQPNENRLITLVQWLETNHGVKTLLVEGGGQVVEQFLKAQLLQTLYLTITPWLIGGTATPSLVGGEGFKKGCFPKLQWQSVEQVDDELFVEATVTYPKN